VIVLVAFDKTCLTLVIIGAINWLLVGLFKFDLVMAIFGNGFGDPSTFSRIIFVLVGLAGLWCITILFKKWHPDHDHDHK
jgi:uncharacterized membrane protein YuzA (DUF378 family)